MTAQEALERWEIFGDGPHLPQIYRDMGLTRLRILAAEEAKPSLPSAMDRMPIPRLNYNPLDRALGRETPPAPAVKEEAPPQAPKSLRDRALTNPARLRTPARKRASFRYHLAMCGFVAEAAERAKVNRSTLYRWRDELPRFAELWDKAIAQRTRAVDDDIILRAGHVEVQPILYAGKKVGERRRIDSRMLMHVQNRLDVDRRRAEDRAERRELAALRTKPLDEAALAERLLVLMERRRETRHSVSHDTTPDTPDSANANKDLDKAA
ncbi:MAG: hypothetical protein EPO55_14900 [Reyranella sp.]|uniref:hypothetical protein n=1 Tax=Reyranella sp. TaxID=1929291 RepID=UPI001208AC06|nr:hypothetical protein [Reyranella sp.]TAJ38645.1 MAG: hypothetical protein EPO55_14900 [Reyranella sp.]